MTAALVLLACVLVDGACSGFRASTGRTGLINHRSEDRYAAARGVGLVLVLLAPATLVAAVDILGGDTTFHQYDSAAKHMLQVLMPYAGIVLLALATYALLDWRRKYLAMALILGPFTLARPFIALAATAIGVATAHHALTVVAILLGTFGLLAVEPVAGRAWSHET